MMKNRIAAIIVSVLLGTMSYAQIEIPISDGGTYEVECGGDIIVLTDAAGAGNYGPGESFTMTFCPGDGGNAISFIIDTEVNGDIFDVASGDALTVFDGPDTDSPILGVYNNGLLDSPVISLFATLDNPGGCLTFLFESAESSPGGAGWTSQINCGNFWQPFDITFSSGPDSEIDADGYIDICQGETITISATGDFPYAADGYNQTVDNTFFEWDMGDGTEFSGLGLVEVTNTYTEQFGYPVTVIATDTLGLMNRYELSIRVSTTPDFSQVIAQYDDTICLGASTTLIGGISQDTSQSFGVFPVQSSFIGGGFLAGQTFLPDGSGASYETSIVIDDFPIGSTIENPEDIVAICATMEHSYLGDLDIELSCPDGTTILLQGQGGGSCNLGIPWATAPVDGQSSNTTPGVGFEYCWTADATLSLEEGCEGGIDFTSGDGPGTYSDSQVPEGNYSPDQPLSDLVGCPINGEWTITVTDNIGADNGYIFSWGVQFDPSIDPNAESYIPTLVDGFWDDDPSIIVDNDTIIEVAPTSTGEFEYTFNVLDDFGCSYDTTVILTVVPAPNAFLVPPACDLEVPYVVEDAQAGGSWSYESEFDSLFVIGIGNDMITVSNPGVYDLTYFDNYCQLEITESIEFLASPIAAIDPEDTLDLCIGQPETIFAFTEQVNDLEVIYTWSTIIDTIGGFGTSLEVYLGGTPDQPFIYTLTVEDVVCGNTAIATLPATLELCEIETYNVFTPNGDGQNDVFFIEDIERFRGSTVYVYNRWGNLLFQRTNYRNDWRLDDVSEGTYYYVIDNPINDETFTGYFTVLR